MARRRRGRVAGQRHDGPRPTRPPATAPGQGTLAPGHTAAEPQRPSEHQRPRAPPWPGRSGRRPVARCQRHAPARTGRCAAPSPLPPGPPRQAVQKPGPVVLARTAAGGSTGNPALPRPLREAPRGRPRPYRAAERSRPGLPPARTPSRPATGPQDQSWQPSPPAAGPDNRTQLPPRAVTGPQDQAWLSSPPPATPDSGSRLPSRTGPQHPARPTDHRPPATRPGLSRRPASDGRSSPQGPAGTGPQAPYRARPDDPGDAPPGVAVTREPPGARRSAPQQASSPRDGGRGGPIRGYPPRPGQPDPVYPPGQFSSWNRASMRAAWLGVTGGAGGAPEAEAEPGYSALALSDAAADLTATQTWAVIDDEPPPGSPAARHRSRDWGSHAEDLAPGRPRAADGGGAPGGPAHRGCPRRRCPGRPHWRPDLRAPPRARHRQAGAGFRGPNCLRRPNRPG